MRRYCLPAAIAALATPAFADEAFVEANLIAILYHELGHAIIDIEEVPIFGQEEDAVDVFSIFLIDLFYQDETALDLARDAAWGFEGEAILRDSEVTYWGVHGPDEQRYFNTVCLFFGADPVGRAGFAEEMGLPQERAEYCPDEYEQANASWGEVVYELTGRPWETATVIYDGEIGADASLTEQIIGQEIALLSEDLVLSQPLSVVVENCGEANAFYDPNTVEIIICAEFEDHLFEMWSQIQQ